MSRRFHCPLIKVVGSCWTDMKMTIFGTRSKRASWSTGLSGSSGVFQSLPAGQWTSASWCLPFRMDPDPRFIFFVHLLWQQWLKAKKQCLCCIFVPIWMTLCRQIDSGSKNRIASLLSICHVENLRRLVFCGSFRRCSPLPLWQQAPARVLWTRMPRRAWQGLMCDALLDWQACQEQLRPMLGKRLFLCSPVVSWSMPKGLCLCWLHRLCQEELWTLFPCWQVPWRGGESNWD